VADTALRHLFIDSTWQ